MAYRRKKLQLQYLYQLMRFLSMKQIKDFQSQMYWYVYVNIIKYQRIIYLD